MLNALTRIDQPRRMPPLGIDVISEPMLAQRRRPENDEMIDEKKHRDLTTDEEPETDENSARERPVPEPATVDPVLKITQSAYRECMHELTSRRPESGGMLLGPTEDDDLVTVYIHDENGKATAASFTIDEVRLNFILSQFRDRGLNCKGLIHSHPAGVTSPSAGDLEYVRKVFANGNNESAGQFFLPIVCDDRMSPYLVRQDAPNRILTAQLRLV